MRTLIGLVVGLVLGLTVTASARIECLPSSIMANVSIGGHVLTCTVDTYGSSKYGLEILC